MSRPQPSRTRDIDLEVHFDEQLLVERVRASDPVAFEALFRCYHRELRAIAEHVTGSRSSAEDVVQEVFLSVWTLRERWHVNISLRAYLRRAVRNVAVRHASSRSVRCHDSIETQAGEVSVSSRAVRDEMEAATLADPGPSPYDDTEAAAMADDVAVATATLSRRAREVFVLSREGGLNTREIAKQLQLSPKTVEMHLTRALAVLRASLARWL